MRSAWSMFSQKTMVLEKRSVALRNSVTLGGHERGARLQDQVAVVVAVVVLAVLDAWPRLVGLADLRPPAVQVLVRPMRTTL